MFFPLAPFFSLRNSLERPFFAASMVRTAAASAGRTDRAPALCAIIPLRMKKKRKKNNNNPCHPITLHSVSPSDLGTSPVLIMPVKRTDRSGGGTFGGRRNIWERVVQTVERQRELCERVIKLSMRESESEGAPEESVQIGTTGLQTVQTNSFRKSRRSNGAGFPIGEAAAKRYQRHSRRNIWIADAVTPAFGRLLSPLCRIT